MHRAMKGGGMVVPRIFQQQNHFGSQPPPPLRINLSAVFDSSPAVPPATSFSVGVAGLPRPPSTAPTMVVAYTVARVDDPEDARRVRVTSPRHAAAPGWCWALPSAVALLVTLGLAAVAVLALAPKTKAAERQLESKAVTWRQIGPCSSYLTTTG